MAAVTAAMVAVQSVLSPFNTASAADPIATIAVRIPAIVVFQFFCILSPTTATAVPKEWDYLLPERKQDSPALTVDASRAVPKNESICLGDTESQHK